jgi:hypothetical protein
VVICQWPRPRRFQQYKEHHEGSEQTTSFLLLLQEGAAGREVRVRDFLEVAVRQHPRKLWFLEDKAPKKKKSK